jgi:hypothetical protein
LSALEDDSASTPLELTPALVSQLRAVTPGFSVALVDDGACSVTADTSFWLAVDIERMQD